MAKNEHDGRSLEERLASLDAMSGDAAGPSAAAPGEPAAASEPPAGEPAPARDPAQDANPWLQPPPAQGPPENAAPEGFGAPAGPEGSVPPPPGFPGVPPYEGGPMPQPFEGGMLPPPYAAMGGVPPQPSFQPQQPWEIAPAPPADASPDGQGPPPLDQLPPYVPPHDPNAGVQPAQPYAYDPNMPGQPFPPDPNAGGPFPPGPQFPPAPGHDGPPFPHDPGAFGPPAPPAEGRPYPGAEAQPGSFAPNAGGLPYPPDAGAFGQPFPPPEGQQPDPNTDGRQAPQNPGPSGAPLPGPEGGPFPGPEGGQFPPGAGPDGRPVPQPGPGAYGQPSPYAIGADGQPVPNPFPMPGTPGGEAGPPPQGYAYPPMRPGVQPQGPYPGQPGPGQPGPPPQPQEPDPQSSESLSSENLLGERRIAPSSGWRRAVYKATAGSIHPGESQTELRRKDLIARARTAVVGGHHRVAVMSLKGGVGKTTTTTGLGSMLGSLRGDRVIAVDANPDRGTLSDKVKLETAATVRDLLNNRDKIHRYADVRAFTSQNPARLEVLASDRDPAVSEAFSAEDYAAVAVVLEQYYSICITDCGTGLLHSAMAGVLSLADQLVLVSSPSVDGARSASATLDWLEAHDHGHLVRNGVVVLSMVRNRTRSQVDLDKLQAHFESRCRAVVRVPYDDHLEEGAEVELEQLAPATREAYLALAAVVGDGFAFPRPDAE
ncbi:MinD/ParA family ATP-binding protein [Spirillospora albida]|uniref:MinD/ParA family ATP-binding protein n=1 Tax=Spirillospora albida TaxID=58123 RepID=UPI000A67564F|nr:MinD/ParA family protein [Spirillospora albida]